MMILKQFTTYATVGILNTLIHWGGFLTVYGYLGVSQSAGNLVAFTVAVVFSFLLNAKWTFQAKASAGRFIRFFLLMAVLSWSVGYVVETQGLHPLITLVTFSGISLIIGFLFAKFTVFGGRP